MNQTCEYRTRSCAADRVKSSDMVGSRSVGVDYSGLAKMPYQRSQR